MRVGAEICEKDLHILGCNAFGCFGILPDSLFRMRYNVIDHCARMKTGAVDRILNAIADPSKALAEKDEASMAVQKFESILNNLKPLLPTGIYEGLEASSRIMRLFTAPHKLLTGLFFEHLKYERALSAEDRLWSIYAIKRTLGELREWHEKYGSALESISLQDLRDKQGIPAETQKVFDQRNPSVSTKEILVLCDRIETTLDAGWEYYKWNIIL